MNFLRGGTVSGKPHEHINNMRDQLNTFISHHPLEGFDIKVIHDIEKFLTGEMADILRSIEEIVYTYFKIGNER